MICIYSIIGVVIAIVAVTTAFYFYKRRKSAASYDYMSFMESLNLTDLPVVTFLVDGKRVNFLLDTGCTISMINKKIVPTLNVHMLDATSTVFGMEGNLSQCDLCTMELEYKGNKYKDGFQILDLDNSFNKIKEESGVNIHGILGTSFFQRYKYVLDFKDLVAYSKK